MYSEGTSVVWWLKKWKQHRPGYKCPRTTQSALVTVSLVLHIYTAPWRAEKHRHAATLMRQRTQVGLEELERSEQPVCADSEDNEYAREEFICHLYLQQFFVQVNLLFSEVSFLNYSNNAPYRKLRILWLFSAVDYASLSLLFHTLYTVKSNVTTPQSYCWFVG